MRKIDTTLMRCGDAYGMGLWLNNFASPYKNVSADDAKRAYAKWLETQPVCGHKKCAAKRKKLGSRILF